MKVLAIGNSFSDNALHFMDKFITAEKGLELQFASACLGGCSLEKHWNLVEQCDLLPDVKPYSFKLSGSGKDEVFMSLKEILNAHQWDYVSLQQVSHCSWRLDTFNPYFDNLYSLVKELAPQATIVLHQTWAYRIDNSEYFSENSIDQQKMDEAIAQNYNTLSQQYNCRILPSGEAIKLARKELAFTKDKTFNYETPTPVQLPKEERSLSIGYLWKTGNTPSGKAELAFDPRHLNDKGCYIAGAVWFEMFSGHPVLENSFAPENISETELQCFKQVAHQAVIEHGGFLSHYMPASPSK
jgi:hypothetical protein